MKRYPILLRILIILIFVITLVFSLIKAKDFLVPVFLSLLFALLVYPLGHFFENRLKIPRIPTNLILILILYAVIIGSVFGMSKLIFNFTDDLPHLKKNLTENINLAQDFIVSKLGVSEKKQDEYISGMVSKGFDQSGKYFSKVFSATTNTLVKFALMPIYIFLFLYYRNKFKRFIYMSVSNDKHRMAEKVIEKIAHVTPNYLAGLLIVVSILAVVNSLGFMVIGIKHAVLFGIIAALMNLIPYLGTVLGFGIVFLFAIATQTITEALWVVIFFIIVQFTENNILTPNITGSRVSINPLVTIMAIVLGGLVWGLPGMFIVIPFLAMFKILCDNVDELNPLGFLMGTTGTEKHSVTWDKIKAFFSGIFTRKLKG